MTFEIDMGTSIFHPAGIRLQNIYTLYNTSNTFRGAQTMYEKYSGRFPNFITFDLHLFYDHRFCFKYDFEI